LMMLALQRGWAVVVSDYEGPQSAFGAARMAGHGVLDGIRAAEALSGTGLTGAQTPVGLWGYSGGGLATSWAAELAAGYAPDLNEFTTSQDPLAEPVAVQVMEDNHLGRLAPKAPVLLYHSLFDELIPYATVQTLQADWCKGGSHVTLYSDAASEHSSLAVSG